MFCFSELVILVKKTGLSQRPVDVVHILCLLQGCGHVDRHPVGKRRVRLNQFTGSPSFNLAFFGGRYDIYYTKHRYY